MMHTNRPIGGYWGLLNPTPNRVSAHSIGVGLLGLLALLRRGPIDPTSPTPIFVSGGTTDRRSHNQAIQQRRVARPTRGFASDRAVSRHAIEDFDQRGPIAAHERGNLLDRETFGVIPQRREDDRVNRRCSLQGAMTRGACTLLATSAFSSVHLLPDVAGRARCDQIVQVVGASFADGQDVIDMQHDVRGELSTVATGELVTFQYGPSDGVPLGTDLTMCAHASILAQFNSYYQIQETVQ